MAFEFIQQQVVTQKQSDLWRQRQIVEARDARYIQITGRRYLNFSSNDYLAMSQETAVINSAIDAAKSLGIGSTSSPLITGYSHYHKILEADLCTWLGVEACLLFNSGYSANSSVIYALTQATARVQDRPDIAIFQDKYNHASLQEAARLSQASYYRFAHNNLEHCQQLLTRHPHQHQLLISEGVFSMDGDQGALRELLALAKKEQAWLLLDDAHGFGVLGKQGKGSPEALGISHDQIPIYIGTFGKAVGTQGAFVAGSQALIDHLIQFNKHYIYSTAMPAMVAAATLTSIQLLRAETWRREMLTELIQYFKVKIQALGLTTLTSDTAIQGIILANNEQCLTLSKQLQQQGIWINAIRPPTVPANSPRLRITLTCAHRKSDIDLLCQTLKSILII